MNPYLALAGQVAAGLDGIRNKLPLPPQGTDENFCGSLPQDLEGALQALEKGIFFVMIAFPFKLVILKRLVSKRYIIQE